MILIAFLQFLSWNLGPFHRENIPNPILAPDPAATFYCPMRKATVRWDHDHDFNPAAITRNGKVYLLYRAEDDSGAGIGAHTSRIGLAESTDGIHFKKRKAPVLYPNGDNAKKYEWPGGCEDPRVVESQDGNYVLTYTAWDRKTARLCVATSKDLIHWQKFGPIFQGSIYENTWSKSGSIITKMERGRVVAARVRGKFWMYWGDWSLHLASSNDLVKWEPTLDAVGKLLTVLFPREGNFDSALVESGPPALLTKDGIVLIYNGKNSNSKGDPNIRPDTYSAGQVLFDAENPSHLLDRGGNYFLTPELAQEKTGQYTAGTVFTEGLALLRNHWYLYYGSADSFVGVTVK